MYKFLVLGAVLSVQLSGLSGFRFGSDEYDDSSAQTDDYVDDKSESSSETWSPYRTRIIRPYFTTPAPTHDPLDLNWLGSDKGPNPSTTVASDWTSTTTEKSSTEPSSSSSISSSDDVATEPSEPIVNPIHKAQTELSNSVRVVGKMLSSEYLVTKGIGAHKLHLRRLSWNKARKVCIDEGGQLADISSDSEEKIILRMLNEENVEFAWIGYHDMFEEGDWVSVRGEPFGKSGWDRWWKVRLPNPDNSGPDGAENCGCLMRDGGGINDNDCDKELPFVCKITAL